MRNSNLETKMDSMILRERAVLKKNLQQIAILQLQINVLRARNIVHNRRIKELTYWSSID